MTTDEPTAVRSYFLVALTDLRTMLGAYYGLDIPHTFNDGAREFLEGPCLRQAQLVYKAFGECFGTFPVGDPVWTSLQDLTTIIPPCVRGMASEETEAEPGEAHMALLSLCDIIDRALVQLPVALLRAAVAVRKTEGCDAGEVAHVLRWAKTHGVEWIEERDHLGAEPDLV